MNLRPLACALVVSLIAATASPDAPAQKKRAAKAKAPATPSACGDFYSHANADWLKGNTLLPDVGSVSALEQLGARARQQQLDLLDAASKSPQNNVQKLLGDFWASGLDEAAVERDGSQPIAPLIARIDAIKNAKDIPPAVAALHQVGIPVLFNFGADIDLGDFNRHIGYFAQGGLGLPDPAYYTRNDADTQALMGRYRNYVEKILALTGTPQAQLKDDAQAVIDLETRIARASRSLLDLRDPRANYAPVETKALAKQYKRLQLGEFLKVQGVTDDRVSMANPQLFSQLDGLVGSLKPAQWKAYLRWRIGDAMAPYLAKPFRDADFEFRGRVLRGLAAPPSRQQAVLDAITLAAGPMVGHEYAARYYSAATDKRAEDIAVQVREALGQALERDTRLSASAKAEAKAKLDKLQIEIGTPNRDLDYTVQPMGRGSFGSNMLIASTWRHREEMKRIGRGNADRRWDVLPQDPSLAYDITQNRLIVTAAMLQPPVFDTTKDAAWLYGSYGALVGHELSHGFDNRGRYVDAKQELRDWWTPAEASIWEALSRRVAAQYGAFEYPDLPGTKLNANQTGDENVADLAGVELAWAAFRAADPSAATPANQSFYRGWASLWPQHMTRETAQQRAATSVHAPGKWRTNGPLRNQAAFAEAFACKEGNAMRVPADQQVRPYP